MKLAILLFGFCMKPFRKNIPVSDTMIIKDENFLIANNIISKEAGIDSRYIEDECNIEPLYKIIQSYRNLEMIRFLQNTYVSDMDKIEEYNQYLETSKYISDITSGGLYKDWNDIF